MIVRSGCFRAFSHPILFTGSVSKLVFGGGIVHRGASCPTFRRGGSHFHLLRAQGIGVRGGGFRSKSRDVTER